MATLKHVKSRNTNYSNAIDYLLFQHNEGTMKPVLDDMGRKLLREEFYIDGINCDPMSFDKECELTNRQFQKNKKKSEIKSHHYIISFDPADTIDHGLTGEKAQSLCLELARKMFPGYQSLIVTHTDGNNNSGNIHTHIVINSVRKNTVEREAYMTQPHDHEAGFKHRSTNIFLQHLQKEIMSMCEREGLYQVDLLSPAAQKITQQEYLVQRTEQKKLDKLNQRIIEDGLKPTITTYQTQKQFLRNAIDECAHLARDFESFQSLLLEKYDISVIESKGRYRYLHPDREQRTSDKALGSHYGKKYLEKIFGKTGHVKDSNISIDETVTIADYQRDPIKILYYKSQLRLVVDLQTNVKAMQNQAYARKVKISNLKQMANTIVYVQEHGFNTRIDLQNTLAVENEKILNSEKQLYILTEELNTINKQIHFVGQYHAHKRIYSAFIKANNKKEFRKNYSDKIMAFENAKHWIDKYVEDEKLLSLETLKKEKSYIQKRIQQKKESLMRQKTLSYELKTVNKNIDEILNMNCNFKTISSEQNL